jgi:predicted transposase YdaD
MPTHAPAYKQLFSHPEMVADLLRGYVHESWVGQIDFTTLERIADSFVTDDLREREDDIIWRVRWGECWLYLYLLIEFQSTVDSHMAVRLLTYVGLLYQDLRRTERIGSGQPLPPVLPIVLYNGDAPWSAATRLTDLLEPDLPATMAGFQPRLRYLLLDEGRIADHPDASLRNLASALFRLEFSPTPDDFRAVWQRLFDWIGHSNQDSLRRAFIAWANRIGLRRHLPSVNLGELHDAQEIANMLATHTTDWTAQWKQQGLQEGLQEGRKQGESKILRRQLQRRFGSLPTWVAEKMECATTDQLESWADALLDAPTLGAVFGDDSGRQQ